MVRIATCCCGNGIVEVNSEPVIHGICHCNNCKKRTGSAFGISSYFKKVDFSLRSGKFSCYKIQNDNGLQERYFCEKCGTTLFWYVDSFKDFVGVAGGCFIDPVLTMPTFATINENKCHWLLLSAQIKTNFNVADIL